MTGIKRQSGLCTADFYSEGNLLVYDAVSDLAVKLHAYKAKHEKKTVLLTSCGASCGTTMIAVNLAIALSRSGRKTLLVDADLRKGSTLEDGLCDYFREKTDLGGVIRPTNLQNLYLAPSGARIEGPALLLCSDRMQEFFWAANSSYEYVIINTPPITVFPDAAALFTNVDGIALVCSLDETTKKQIEMAKDAVAPFADKYYGIVINSMREKQYRKLFARSGGRRGTAWK